MDVKDVARHDRDRLPRLIARAPRDIPPPGPPAPGPWVRRMKIGSADSAMAIIE